MSVGKFWFHPEPATSIWCERARANWCFWEGTGGILWLSCGPLGGMKYDKESMSTYGELDSINTMHCHDILQRIDASLRCILISRHHTAPMTGHKESMSTYGELDSINTMHCHDILQRIDASLRCILISLHHTAPMTGHKASMSTYGELRSMNTSHYKEMCQQIDACLRCIAITEHQK